jgi:hypothetical protein
MSGHEEPVGPHGILFRSAGSAIGGFTMSGDQPSKPSKESTSPIS